MPWSSDDPAPSNVGIHLKAGLGLPVVHCPSNLRLPYRVLNIQLVKPNKEYHEDYR